MHVEEVVANNQKQKRGKLRRQTCLCSRWGLQNHFISISISIRISISGGYVLSMYLQASSSCPYQMCLPVYHLQTSPERTNRMERRVSGDEQ